MHNKTRKNCIKLIKTIEKCKKVVYYEAINKEETGRGTTNNKGGGIVDRRDHDRCQELYVKYRQFMYWYVKKHFPDLPEEDIRDILQEVWTSLLNAIDKLYDKGDEGQFAWLIRVTQTKVIDYYRSRKRTEELGQKIGLALREQQEVGSVQDIVIARMIAMELVEGLTEEERRILAIEYFSDTTGEVSNAFKCRRSRLRRKIEESLGIFRKKRDKIYDSPEYKQIKEHLPEILKELERDKGLSQYQIPEEWNGDFERIYQKECRKEHIKRRILAGACAAVILTISAVHIGTHLEFTSVAQADDIGKTAENGFEDGNYQYSTNGNVEENDDSLIIDDSEEIIFGESNLKDLYENLKMETKAPIICLTSLDDNSKVTYATYNKRYRAISYRTIENNTYIYVSQKKQVEETSDGAVNKNNFVKEMEIPELDIKTSIYESTQDNSLYCNLIYDNNMISIVSNMDLENFMILLKGLEYY